MAKKKVLFVSVLDSFMFHFLIPYLKMFHARGYEVHVATSENGKIPFCDKKHQIPLHRNPFHPDNLKAIKQLRKIVDRERFDIVHCHTPMGGVTARIAAKKSRKLGTRVIYTAHGFHFFKGAPLYYWLLFYPMEKYLSKFTDILITINQEDYLIAKQKFTKCRNICYMPGIGMDTRKFEPWLSAKEKLQYRKNLGFTKNDFLIIFPAEVSKNKRQNWIIHSLKTFLKNNPSAHLIFPGMDRTNGAYAELAKNLGLSNQVHFLGYRKDIPSLLQISDLAISASKREGLPVNIMEAMYAGLPVVATACRGNRDLIKNNSGGKIVEIGDTVGFSKAIENLYKNQDRRISYGKFNKTAVQEYLLSNVQTACEQIYFKKKLVYIRSTSIYNDSRAQKEIKALKKQYDVTVLGWNRDQKKYNNQDKSLILYDRKAGYGNGLKNIFNLLHFQHWIKKQLKNFKGADCIYACDFDTAYTASKIARKYRIKFIYDIYDYYIDCHHAPWPLNAIIEKMDIRTINRADLTIICSDNRIKQIAKATPKNITIIYNSINLDDYTLAEHICKTPKDKNKIKIAYVGILHDHRLLKEVANKVKNEENIELHIGGFGKYQNYFKELTKKHKNIIFYGELKYPDVLSLEKSCDVLFATYDPALPNHQYSAPNKVYEAMALAKPIIVCKNTGIDDVVVKNHIGVAISYNADEFIDAIKHLPKFDANNFDKVYKKYGWQKMEQTLLENVAEAIEP